MRKKPLYFNNHTFAFYILYYILGLLYIILYISCDSYLTVKIKESGCREIFEPWTCCAAGRRSNNLATAYLTLATPHPNYASVSPLLSYATSQLSYASSQLALPHSLLSFASPYASPPIPLSYASLSPLASLIPLSYASPCLASPPAG